MLRCELNGFYHLRGKLVMDNYRNAELPFPVLERHSMSVRITFRVFEFTAFLQSFYAYRMFRERNIDNTLTDDLTELRAEEGNL